MHRARVANQTLLLHRHQERGRGGVTDFSRVDAEPAAVSGKPRQALAHAAIIEMAKEISPSRCQRLGAAPGDRGETRACLSAARVKLITLAHRPAETPAIAG